jgi:DNA-binding NarL/FixJ family response regulator
VAAGRRYVGGPVAEALADRLQRNGEGAAHEQLSDREYEVLCLIAAGRSLKEIGAQLTLAESTVSTYRARVLEKLRLSTTAELVRYALEHKLVE